MAQTKYAKPQRLPKREHDKVQALKDDYLQTVYRKKKVLGSWKLWELIRRVTGIVAWLALLLYTAVGFFVWNTVENPSREMYYIFNLRGHELSIYRGTVEYIAAGLVWFAGLFVIYLILGIFCRSAYKKYATKSDHAEIKLDNLKREKIDHVLENQIVVSVRSIFETLVEYEDVLDGEEEDDDEYEYFDADKVGVPEARVFTGAVDNAVVYIDGIEVGAVDLDSEFSCFRVEPGLHSLKIIIRKEFPYYGKQLVLETPINPIRVDGDYRIVLYSLCTKQNKGVIRYKLKVAEYDDMVIFMRDTRQAGNIDELHNADRLSGYLRKRSKKLHAKIFGVPETEEQRRARESYLYGEETVNMEDLSKNMGSTYHDARFKQTSKVEVVLNQSFDNPLGK